MSRTTLVVATLAALALSAAASQQGHAAERGASQQVLAPDIVRDIQRGLNQRGYGAGSVDGVLGQRTRAAIARFQRDNSLPGRGQIDERSLAALGIIGLPASSEAELLAAPASQTLSPEMVRDIQGELQRLGYDVGRVDGVWGNRTRRALREFQRERNLAATGRIDTGTLAALQAGGVTQTGEMPQQPPVPRR